jgi:transposase
LDDPFVCCQIEALIAHFETFILETEASIQALIKADPSLEQAFKLITSIKGIGEKTAQVYLAELGDIYRFPSIKQLTAFVGLDILDYQSGSSVKRPAHISKQGSARLRTALYMPALTAIKHNPACRHLNERLEKAHKEGKVRIVAVMRKLLHQIYGVLKSGKPFDPYYDFPKTT